MNIKEYIESGIIESVVLGLASEFEQKEFDALCIQYPGILSAVKSFELDLEDKLMKEAVAPPPYLKEKILLSLNIPGSDSVQQEKRYTTPVHKLNVWKWVAAACILLFAVSVYLAYSVNNKYQNLLNANIKAANRFDHSSHANAIIALKAVVERPSVKWSIMVEPSNETHCMAHIYWDSLSKNTFLLLGNIPKPVSDKQFQLWANLDHHPVNLGTFDVKKEGQLIQMKNINNAKTFYITLEPKGGSNAPNTQTTYAVGEL